MFVTDDWVDMAYNKVHTCECGTTFEARTPRRKYCDPCRVRVRTEYEMSRYERVGVQRRQEYVDKNRDRLREQARARYARNRLDPDFRRMRHTAVLMGRYGISADDLDRMIKEQENRCAICDRHVDEVHRDGRGLHVDHDHLLAERGAGAEAVRGLLCFGCNTTVGRLLDDPEVAHRFAAYLQASEAKRAAYGL